MGLEPTIFCMAKDRPTRQHPTPPTEYAWLRGIASQELCTVRPCRIAGPDLGPDLDRPLHSAHQRVIALRESQCPQPMPHESRWTTTGSGNGRYFRQSPAAALDARPGPARSHGHSLTIADPRFSVGGLVFSFRPPTTYGDPCRTELSPPEVAGSSPVAPVKSPCIDAIFVVVRTSSRVRAAHEAALVGRNT